MPPSSSRESLKRRRENYQLSLHQYTELQRHRGCRSEKAVPVDDYCFSAPREHCTGTAFHHPQCLPAAAASAHGGAAARGFTAGNTPLYEKPTCASPRSDDRASEAPHAYSSVKSDGEDARHPHTLALHLRPLRVDVVRGDTGRRVSFALQTAFFYAWQRANHFYRSLDGEQVGLELQESVVCQVLPRTTPLAMHASRGMSSPYLAGAPPPMSPSWPFRPTQTCETAEHAVAHKNGFFTAPFDSTTFYGEALQHNEEAATATPPPASLFFSGPASELACRTSACSSYAAPAYSYEATQVSRCLLPPSRPPPGAEDVCAHLGSCSPALFVDCLLKCIRDEAALPDDQGWVYLYHGRHVLTDGGRARLLHDLFTQACDEATGEAEEYAPAALTVCVFRKY